MNPPLPPNTKLIEPTPANPAFATVAELGRWLRARQSSSIQLTEYYLERLSTLGPRLNALVTLTRDRALREARRADEELLAGKDRGPLHGIPYGVKDLLATAGDPTTWGAAPYSDRRFDFDATVVERLSAAGAVLLGKLAMVEIAGGMGYRQANASFTGPGLNPWDLTTWSGGSSTGPGSAVGAGLVPFAIGSETWGSILTPATYCGITGVRPTYGRVSRHGAMALSWTMDKLGPMTRSAEDSALVLSAIAGPDPKDPTSLPQPFVGMADEPGRPWRFAILPDEQHKPHPAIEANYRACLEWLKQVGTIQTLTLPPLPYDSAAGIILSAEMASAMEELIGTAEARSLTAPEDHVGGIADQLIPARDYLQALRVRGRAIRVVHEALAEFDAVVTPALGTLACRIDVPFAESRGNHHANNLGGVGNLIGLPFVCVPNGFSEEGLPTGLQFLGKALSEEKLLRMAHQYQSSTHWHRRAPFAFAPT